MNKVLKKINRNKQWLLFSLFSTLLWGISAHGYGFTQSNFSHDSLSEFNGAYFGNAFKIQLGRFVIPFYRAVFRTDLTLPWLIGVLALVWIAFSVFFVLKIFRIGSKMVAFLTAGIFTTNITVIAAAATYLHDFDCDMFALLSAVLAVYFWKEIRGGDWSGAVFVALSLGIYQSYVSVTIVLVMLVCILELLDGVCFKTVFVKGLKAIKMLLLGGAAYYAVMKMVLLITDIPLSSGEYNSLDRALDITLNELPAWVFSAYKDCGYRFLCAVSSYPDWLARTIGFLLILVTGVSVLIGLGNKRVKMPEKVLCMALLALLPLGMNLTYVLVMGDTHDLMSFAIWLLYLFALLMAERLSEKCKARSKGERDQKKEKAVSYISAALVFVLLYGNVQTANAVYLKKDLEQDAFLSLMTRVVYRIEDFDDYVPEITPVVIAGLPEQLNDVIPGFEKYQRITGAWSAYVLQVSDPSRYQAYFDFIQLCPITVAEETVWEAMQSDPRVLAMPNYPSDGCLAMIDGVLVVKLGDQFA